MYDFMVTRPALTMLRPFTGRLGQTLRDAALANTLAAALLLLAGCGDDSASPANVEPELGTPASALSCPGAVVADAGHQRVYVASSGSDVADCGQTPDTACASIQTGIGRCTGGGAGSNCKVVVQHGRYTTSAPVELKNGVDVAGSCVFPGEADSGYRTTLVGNADLRGPVVTAAGISSPTSVSGLVVMAPDSTDAGSASVALSVVSSSGLALRDTVWIAGKGATGADGTIPLDSRQGFFGRSPIVGDSGSSWNGTGGAGGSSCDASSLDGVGGRGADKRSNVSSNCGPTVCDCNPFGGANGADGGRSGPAAGGAGGGVGRIGPSCTNAVAAVTAGGNGIDGNPGANGQQGGQPVADLWGRFTQAQWMPAAGGSGAPGAVGSGGGGGGAGGVCVSGGFLTSPIDFHGLPGSGGGGGGCGGGGGGGAGQGGASIAVVLSDAKLASWDNVAAIPGTGGDGGQGGSGSHGGNGGNPGTVFGTPGYHACSSFGAGGNEGGFGGNGGPGGYGGRGGNGAGGSGGNGGPAVGVALVGSSVAPTTGADVYRGWPGVGGMFGSGGDDKVGHAADGSTGVGGGGVTVARLDVAPKNVLSAGQTLQHGQSRVSPDGLTTFLMQNDGNVCIYKNNTDYQWCSYQAGLGMADNAAMQSDGNFCLNRNGQQRCTDTAGHPRAYLSVEPDGHVVVYDGTQVLWRVPQ